MIVERAGGVRTVAEEIGRSTQLVHQWEYVPAKHVKAVAKLSGLAPKTIRPDIF